MLLAKPRQGPSLRQQRWPPGTMVSACQFMNMLICRPGWQCRVHAPPRSTCGCPGACRGMYYFVMREIIVLRSCNTSYGVVDTMAIATAWGCVCAGTGACAGGGGGTRAVCKCICTPALYCMVCALTVACVQFSSFSGTLLIGAGGTDGRSVVGLNLLQHSM